MGFFTAKQKRMARKYSVRQLESGYLDTDHDMRMASYEGDVKALRRTMKVHSNYERAILYKNTPKYNKKSK
ncbi:MAG: hypothetical protein NC311_08530 [Muribaculaceae bacterium]|nr:hypothetical protein [Muribaculaceae bacterium]